MTFQERSIEGCVKEWGAVCQKSLGDIEPHFVGSNEKNNIFGLELLDSPSSESDIVFFPWVRKDLLSELVSAERGGMNKLQISISWCASAQSAGDKSATRWGSSMFSTISKVYVSGSSALFVPFASTSAFAELVSSPASMP